MPIANTADGHRTVLYGPGGIGKSTLACLASREPGDTVFVDADESLPRLRAQLQEMGARLPRLAPVTDWTTLRDTLRSDGWEKAKIRNIVLDTGTKIQEWCIAQTLRSVKHEKGHNVKSIEDYGYGKGYQHVYETWLHLLSDLDRHARQGRNVFIICHEVANTVPNPEGDDWLRYEPDLQSPKSGNSSIRLRMKNWSDHLLFLGYDVTVKDGVGLGSGTRTLYTSELPHCMAKSRTTQDQIPIVKGESPWDLIIK